MPKFQVKGYDRATGEQTSQIVDARDTDHAVKMAGLVTESVEPYIEPPPTPKPLEPIKMTPEQEFSGMGDNANLIRSLGGIITLLGVVMFGVGLSLLAAPEGRVAAIGAVATGVTWIFVGILTGSLAWVMKALQVMAINSYR